jgi:hypothetical protein
MNKRAGAWSTPCGAEYAATTARSESEIAADELAAGRDHSSGLDFGDPRSACAAEAA